MQCPVCDIGLVLTERQGIEIDSCPKCRGIWLDRGELDKLIERGASPARLEEHRSSGDRRDDGSDDDDRGRSSGRVHPGRRGRRGSFLGELFDFD